MCGISGVIKNKFSKIDLKESIFKILNLQNHRGPDKSDLIKLNENLIFGHNRLSIQDLSFVLSGIPVYFLFFKHKVNG